MNTNKTYRPAFRLLTSLFFIWGFITVSNDILINTFQKIFDLSAQQQALVQMSFFGAFFVVSLLYFIVSEWTGQDPINKIGYKNGMTLGLFICGLSCCMFYPAAYLHSYSAFLLALFSLATGVTLLQICANPYATILGPPESASSRLNLAQGLNSLGTTLGPFVGTILIYQVFSNGVLDIYAVAKAYLIYGLFFICLALLTFLSKMPAFKADKVEGGNWSAIFKNRHLSFGILAIFFYVGAEVSIGSWLVKFLQTPNIGGMEQEEASFYLPYFWGGLMIGRLSGAICYNENIKQKRKIWQMAFTSILVFLFLFFIKSISFQNGIFTVDVPLFSSVALYLLFILIMNLAFLASLNQPAKSLTIFSAINILLIAVAIFSSGNIAMWCIIGTGLFFSIGWSNIFSLAISNLKENTAKGSSLLVMAIVGGAALPGIQSLIIDHYNVQLSFIIPLLAVTYLLFYGIYGHKQN